MPRARAFSSTPLASSAEYIRNRLPQPMARMETEAPVRPSVRWGIVPAAASAGRGDVLRAAAALAMALLSRNSRRETFSRFMFASVLRRFHAGGVEIPRHGLRVVGERHLRLLDLG